MLAVAIRHPGTGQPVDRVVVIALCGKQGSAGDGLAGEGGVVLLHPGKTALAVVEGFELRPRAAAGGPAADRLIKVVVFVLPATAVAVALLCQGPFAGMVGVLDERVGAANFNGGEQIRLGIGEIELGIVAPHVVVADLHQAIVRVGVGNVAGAAALNAGQAAPVVIGVGGHVPPGIGHARYQRAVGVVLVRVRVPVVPGDGGGHVPVGLPV